MYDPVRKEKCGQMPVVGWLTKLRELQGQTQAARPCATGATPCAKGARPKATPEKEARVQKSKDVGYERTTQTAYRIAATLNRPPGEGYGSATAKQ